MDTKQKMKLIVAARDGLDRLMSSADFGQVTEYLDRAYDQLGYALEELAAETDGQESEDE